MEPSFITIAQACEQTGKSASTIRRLIHGITQKDDHADRALIQPDPKKVAAFKKKGENFTWTIREDLVARSFSGAQKKAKKETSEPSNDILSVLKDELSLKNQQIEKQWEVIHALNDRLREGNILMGSLQKRLSLPAEKPQEDVVETTTVMSSKETPAKKRWWSRSS